MPLDVDRLPAAVGARIRDARTQRGWTLDQLADVSGVSRRMIVNVEAGTTNASLATLLRLATSLHVSLAELIADPGTGPVAVTTTRDRVPLWTGTKGGTAHLVSSADTPDMLELWEWRMHPGEGYSSDAHRLGTHELLHVHSGELALTVGNESRTLRTGDAASFSAAVDHAYACSGRRPVRFSMTVLEPQARVRP